MFDVKKILLDFLFFLAIWVTAYFVVDFGTWWLAFLIAILFLRGFDKGVIIDLANNFDLNHNNLLSIVDDLKLEVENLSRDYDDLKNELLDAQNQIEEFGSRGAKPDIDFESEHYKSFD